MRRYEGLFILDTIGSADGGSKGTAVVKKLIVKAGGKVEAEQKMDRRQFARVANKKHTGGFYTNLLFELEPAAMDGFIRTKSSSSLWKRRRIEILFRLQSIGTDNRILLRLRGIICREG